MNIDAVRRFCRALPGVAEDVKWGHDLCFCVAGKMFAAVDLEPPHSLSFKCTPEEFADLVERPGINSGALRGAKHVGARTTVRRNA
jgi:predicted DNA-binding protein (MmcQ/YjbR family)